MALAEVLPPDKPAFPVKGGDSGRRDIRLDPTPSTTNVDCADGQKPVSEVAYVWVIRLELLEVLCVVGHESANTVVSAIRALDGAPGSDENALLVHPTEHRFD